MEKALFRSSDLVQKMRCHSLFTVPIGLAYAPPGAIQDCYGSFLVQPMVPLRQQGVPWGAEVDEAGYDLEAMALFRNVLAQRLDVDHLFWNPSDVEALVRMSGGCLRDLMHLVGQAAAARESGSTRLNGEAVQRAFQQLRATYARPLEAEDWKLLARMARGGTVEDGARRRTLLFRRAALLYSDDHGKEWYNVHPLLVETLEFQDAYRDALSAA